MSERYNPLTQMVGAIPLEVIQAAANRALAPYGMATPVAPQRDPCEVCGALEVRWDKDVNGVTLFVCWDCSRPKEPSERPPQAWWLRALKWLASL